VETDSGDPLTEFGRILARLAKRGWTGAAGQARPARRRAARRMH
jgi:hypothetical protein